MQRKSWLDDWVIPVYIVSQIVRPYFSPTKIAPFPWRNEIIVCAQFLSLVNLCTTHIAPVPIVLRLIHPSYAL